MSLATSQIGEVSATGLTPEHPNPKDKPARKKQTYQEVRAERKRMSAKSGYNRRTPQRGILGASSHSRSQIDGSSDIPAAPSRSSAPSGSEPDESEKEPQAGS
jgi:hypothetical protein